MRNSYNRKLIQMRTRIPFRRSFLQVWSQVTGEAGERRVLLPDELPQASSAMAPEQSAPGPIKEFRDYRNFFLRLPRAVRIIAYILTLILMPAYIGLSFKFVRDELDEHLENLEIRFLRRDPRHWFSAVEKIFDPKFPGSWPQIPAPSQPIKIADMDKASLEVPSLALFKLNPLYDIYDFQAEMDIAYHGQESAAWAIRANSDATEMYLFVLRFSKGSPPLKLDAYDVMGQTAKKLYVFAPAPEFKPLTDKAAIHVHIWSDACVFPVSLLVEDSGQPSVPSIAYGEVPCRQHGTLGVAAFQEQSEQTFKRVWVCSASESAKYSCGMDFATLLQNGATK